MDSATIDQLLIDEFTTPYAQIDLTNIEPVPSTKIRTPKDLEREAKVIWDTLSNKKNDWQRRLKCIQVIQQCFVTPEILGMPSLASFISKVVEPLSQQLFDLRSAITREACRTIALIAEVLQNDFDGHAGNLFVTDISLFKLMESGNHLMAEHAHNCVVSILYNTCSQKVLKNILRQSTDRHQYTRINCAEYLLLIFIVFPIQVLDKYTPDFYEYLKKTIPDPNPEVRKRARAVFIKFHQLYPQDSHDLLVNFVDVTYQKAIFDDYISLGLNPDTTGLFNTADQDPYQQVVRSISLNDNSPASMGQLSNSMLLVSSKGNVIQGTKSLYENNGLLQPPEGDDGAPLSHRAQAKAQLARKKSPNHNFVNNNNKASKIGKQQLSKFKSPSRAPATTGARTNASSLRGSMTTLQSITASKGIANQPKVTPVKSVRQTLAEFNNNYQKDSSSAVGDSEYSANYQPSSATQMSEQSSTVVTGTKFGGSMIGSMRSPSRRNGEAQKMMLATPGRGSPRPNKAAVQSKVDSGLGSMVSRGSPRRPARGGDQLGTEQKSESSQYGGSTITSSSNAAAAASNRLKQLKKSHYPTAALRKSPTAYKRSPAGSPTAYKQRSMVAEDEETKDTNLKKYTANVPQSASRTTLKKFLNQQIEDTDKVELRQPAEQKATPLVETKKENDGNTLAPASTPGQRRTKHQRLQAAQTELQSQFSGEDRFQHLQPPSVPDSREITFASSVASPDITKTKSLLKEKTTPIGGGPPLRQNTATQPKKTEAEVDQHSIGEEDSLQHKQINSGRTGAQMPAQSLPSSKKASVVEQPETKIRALASPKVPSRGSPLRSRGGSPPRGNTRIGAGSRTSPRPIQPLGDFTDLKGEAGCFDLSIINARMKVNAQGVVQHIEQNLENLTQDSLANANELEIFQFFNWVFKVWNEKSTVGEKVAGKCLELDFEGVLSEKLFVHTLLTKYTYDQTNLSKVMALLPGNKPMALFVTATFIDLIKAASDASEKLRLLKVLIGWVPHKHMQLLKASTQRSLIQTILKIPALDLENCQVFQEHKYAFGALPEINSMKLSPSEEKIFGTQEEIKQFQQPTIDIEDPDQTFLIEENGPNKYELPHITEPFDSSMKDGIDEQVSGMDENFLTFKQTAEAGPLRVSFISSNDGDRRGADEIDAANSSIDEEDFEEQISGSKQEISVSQVMSVHSQAPLTSPRTLAMSFSEVPRVSRIQQEKQPEIPRVSCPEEPGKAKADTEGEELTQFLISQSGESKSNLLLDGKQLSYSVNGSDDGFAAKFQSFLQDIEEGKGIETTEIFEVFKNSASPEKEAPSASSREFAGVLGEIISKATEQALVDEVSLIFDELAEVEAEFNTKIISDTVLPALYDKLDVPLIFHTLSLKMLNVAHPHMSSILGYTQFFISKTKNHPEKEACFATLSEPLANLSQSTEQFGDDFQAIRDLALQCVEAMQQS